MKALFATVGFLGLWLADCTCDQTFHYNETLGFGVQANSIRLYPGEPEVQIPPPGTDYEIPPSCGGFTGLSSLGDAIAFTVNQTSRRVQKIFFSNNDFAALQPDGTIGGDNSWQTRQCEFIDGAGFQVETNSKDPFACSRTTPFWPAGNDAKNCYTPDDPGSEPDITKAIYSALDGVPVPFTSDGSWSNLAGGCCQSPDRLLCSLQSAPTDTVDLFTTPGKNDWRFRFCLDTTCTEFFDAPDVTFHYPPPPSIISLVSESCTTVRLKKQPNFDPATAFHPDKYLMPAVNELKSRPELIVTRDAWLNPPEDMICDDTSTVVGAVSIGHARDCYERGLELLMNDTTVSHILYSPITDTSGNCTVYESCNNIANNTNASAVHLYQFIKSPCSDLTGSDCNMTRNCRLNPDDVCEAVWPCARDEEDMFDFGPCGVLDCPTTGRLATTECDSSTDCNPVGWCGGATNRDPMVMTREECELRRFCQEDPIDVSTCDWQADPNLAYNTPRLWTLPGKGKLALTILGLDFDKIQTTVTVNGRASAELDTSADYSNEMETEIPQGVGYGNPVVIRTVQEPVQQSDQFPFFSYAGPVVLSISAADHTCTQEGNPLELIDCTRRGMRNIITVTGRNFGNDPNPTSSGTSERFPSCGAAWRTADTSALEFLGKVFVGGEFCVVLSACQHQIGRCLAFPTTQITSSNLATLPRFKRQARGKVLSAYSYKPNSARCIAWSTITNTSQTCTSDDDCDTATEVCDTRSSLCRDASITYSDFVKDLESQCEAYDPLRCFVFFGGKDFSTGSTHEGPCCFQPLTVDRLNNGEDYTLADFQEGGQYYQEDVDPQWAMREMCYRPYAITNGTTPTTQGFTIELNRDDFEQNGISVENCAPLSNRDSVWRDDCPPCPNGAEASVRYFKDLAELLDLTGTVSGTVNYAYTSEDFPLQVCQCDQTVVDDNLNNDPSLSSFVCRLPRGNRLNRPVLLLQNNGEISIVADNQKITVAYAQCQPGSYEGIAFDGEDPYACFACPKGSYSRGLNTQVPVFKCHPCQAGSFQNTTGNTDCLSCPRGRYSSVRDAEQRVEECAPCEPGKFTSSEGQLTCVACPQGKFQRETGQGECDLCPLGRHNDAQLSDPSQIGECSPCKAGKYSDSEGRPTCHPCGSGKYMPDEEAVECTFCGTGETSMRGGFQDVVSPRYAPANMVGFEVCQLCAPGYYSNAVQQSNCNACNPGKFSGPEVDVAILLEEMTETLIEQWNRTDAGYNTKDERLPFTSCQRCPKGKASSGTGIALPSTRELDKCEVCQPGFYQTTKGNEKCSPCEAGKYSTWDVNDTIWEWWAEQGMVPMEQCMDCEPGRFSEQCKSLFRHNETTGRCEEDLSDNRYSYPQGATYCSLCPKGKYQGAKGQSLCFDAVAGTFTDTVGAIASKDCPVGKFVPTSPDGTNSGCIDAPAGKYAGSTALEEAIECKIGHYSPTSGPEGQRVIGEFSGDCFRCTPGRFAHNKGSVRCNTCDKGKYSSTSQQDCQPCADNLFSPYTGLSACIPCGDNSVGTDLKLGCVCNKDYYGAEKVVMELGFPGYVYPEKYVKQSVMCKPERVITTPEECEAAAKTFNMALDPSDNINFIPPMIRQNTMINTEDHPLPSGCIWDGQWLNQTALDSPTATPGILYWNEEATKDWTPAHIGDLLIICKATDDDVEQLDNRAASSQMNATGSTGSRLDEMGWAPSPDDQLPYLELDFGVQNRLVGLHLRGPAGTLDPPGALTFTVQYTEYGDGTWDTLMEGEVPNRFPQVFEPFTESTPGFQTAVLEDQSELPEDERTKEAEYPGAIADVEFDSYFLATAIRIYPTTWSSTGFRVAARMIRGGCYRNEMEGPDPVVARTWDGKIDIHQRFGPRLNHEAVMAVCADPISFKVTEAHWAGTTDSEVVWANLADALSTTSEQLQMLNNPDENGTAVAPQIGDTFRIPDDASWRCTEGSTDPEYGEFRGVNAYSLHINNHTCCEYTEASCLAEGLPGITWNASSRTCVFPAKELCWAEGGRYSPNSTAGHMNAGCLYDDLDPNIRVQPWYQYALAARKDAAESLNVDRFVFGVNECTKSLGDSPYLRWGAQQSAEDAEKITALYYSVYLPMCKECPDHMECDWDTSSRDFRSTLRSSTSPKPGYWPIVEGGMLYPNNYLSCTAFQDEACLGVGSENYPYSATCNPGDPSCNLGGCDMDSGYKGVLCLECFTPAKGFFAENNPGQYLRRSGSYGCAICPETWQSVLVLMLIVCVLLAFMSVLVALQRRSLHKSSQHAILTKILLSALQLNSLATHFEYDWPGEVQDGLKAQESVVSLANTFLAIDCFVDTSNMISPFFIKCLLFFFVPPIAVCAPLLVFRKWWKLGGRPDFHKGLWQKLKTCDFSDPDAKKDKKPDDDAREKKWWEKGPCCKKRAHSLAGHTLSGMSNEQEIEGDLDEDGFEQVPAAKKDPMAAFDYIDAMPADEVKMRLNRSAISRAKLEVLERVSTAESSTLRSLLKFQLMNEKAELGKARNFYATIVVVVLFVIHPSLTQITFQLFACKNLLTDVPDVEGYPEVPSNWRLIRDFTLECYTLQHAWWMVLGVIMMILYAFGIPMGAYLLLRKNSKRLRETDVVAKYSFLYKGYKRKFYMWEMVIMGRKLLMVCITVFFASQVQVQSLLAILLCVCSLSIHAIASPFEDKLMNWMEFYSLVTSFTTFFCGQFLFALPNDTGARIVISMAILTINLSFVIIIVFLLWSKVTKAAREQKSQYLAKRQQLSDIFLEVTMAQEGYDMKFTGSTVKQEGVVDDMELVGEGETRFTVARKDGGVEGVASPASAAGSANASARSSVYDEASGGLVRDDGSSAPAVELVEMDT